MPSPPHRLVALGRRSAYRLASIDPADDMRGREALDALGLPLGRVEEVLVDEREVLPRLIRVRLGGSAAEVGARLVPVEALSRVSEQQVTVNRVLAHVAAGPADDRGARGQRYLESVYAHYGYYPYWEPGYVYPSYPVYP